MACGFFGQAAFHFDELRPKAPSDARFAPNLARNDTLGHSRISESLRFC